MAKELEQASLRLMPKTSFDKARDFLGGIFFALLIAVLIRTMWFELDTILRADRCAPRWKKKIYLIVSKTDYGINVPLQEAHFYFDPDPCPTGIDHRLQRRQHGHRRFRHDLLLSLSR